MDSTTAVGVGVVTGMGLLVAIVVWVVVGLGIGALARFLMKGPDPMGLGKTALLGMAGSVIGGVVSQLLRIDGFLAFVPAVLGAMLLLWIGRKRKRTA